MCRKYGIECGDKWYEHQPLAVAENRGVRITWNMTVCTDKKLNHNRPDITVVRKDTQEWTLIDIAVPADKNIINTEEGKVDRHSDLAFETKRIHRALKMTVIPITHLLNYSLTYPFTHPLTYSLIYSLTHSLTQSLTHSPIHLLTHSLTRKCLLIPTYEMVCSVLLSVCARVHCTE